MQKQRSGKFNNEPIYASREKDWRMGAVVYQVFVDRFAPASDIEDKKALYAYPKKLRKWHEIPTPGPYLPEVKYTAHELDYWGGDLNSVKGKLDYIQSLGADVLYLNPIHKSLSNHKYDASDYLKISPEYGSFDDLKSLADAAHQNQMRLVLDGVFNHVGISSELFLDAKDPKHPKHAWFDFNEKYPEGIRLWADVRSLPELNLEHPDVRDYIYQADDSVIKTYLRAGIDGWRLDVAFDIGFDLLKEIADAAHDEKQGSLVVGEIWNYPKDWLSSIDGVMNFTFRELILKSLKGEISANKANQLLAQIIGDATYEGILKSWNILDNHDTPRLVDILPDNKDRKLAQLLQFTLPGSPNLYYGSEVGMNGKDDPMNRAPMRWDLVDDYQADLVWTKSLIRLHQQNRAIKIGDYVPLVTENLIAFERKTDKVCDTVLVFVNPNDTLVKETILVPDSKLMNFSEFTVISGQQTSLRMMAGFMQVEVPAKTYLVCKPDTTVKKSYTAYKRV